ncbi:MAG: hypothetical protein LBQ20_08060 [Rhodanobacter sp.]|jgi:predicted MFS family arabinose efflux permease|nr:hypothetical protein [Rhodanobacter sp.]
MLRWIMLVFMLVGFVLIFLAKSAGVLAIGLLLTGVGVVGFIGALAVARISAHARPEAAMASPEDLLALHASRTPPPKP